MIKLFNYVQFQTIKIYHFWCLIDFHLCLIIEIQSFTINTNYYTRDI